ncbi:hypothetical protein D5086_020201 [Populus alba]|uniref:Uncharacterized protein n=1 Tax=Populus alba TaxID=43335 RepID=A0ACC4BJD7_POPAL
MGISMESGLVSCTVYYLNLVATVGQPLALTLLEKAKRTSACFFLSSEISPHHLVDAVAASRPIIEAAGIIELEISCMLVSGVDF